MTDSKPREAGWYWVRGYDGRWLPDEWQIQLGEGIWHSVFVGRRSKEPPEIGPRIYPPGEAPAAEQCELIAALEMARAEFRLLVAGTPISRSAATDVVRVINTALAKHAPPSPEDKP